MVRHGVQTAKGGKGGSKIPVYRGKNREFLLF